MEELICYFNGQYIKESEAKISILDWALREGTVFDIERTYCHVPFFWREHIDRLFCSLRYLRIDPGLSPEEIYHISLEVLERNRKYLTPEDDFIVIQRISRGASTYFLGPPPTQPTVLVHCVHLLPVYEQQAKHYQEGIHLVVVSTRQIPPQCLDVKSKNTNRFCNTLAEFEAKMVDPAAWPLMLDISGFVAEGPTYSCLMVREGKLLMPRLTNILPGITRATLLRLAKELGIESIETDLCVYDLYNADEILVTANSFTIFPVAKFNERVMPKPIPGPVTQQLFSAFNKLVGFDMVQRVVSCVKTKAKATG